MVLGSTWFGTGAGIANTTTTHPFVATTGARPPGVRVVVHVSGAVVRPGLVTVDGEPRVADVIAAAGGAIRSADLGRLNLAATVRDGEHIHVPSTEDHVASAAGVGATAAAGNGIDLNTADAATLEQLPGVGPVLAGRIVAHRDERGPFATVEDLLDVPGIGEAKLAMLRDDVTAP